MSFYLFRQNNSGGDFITNESEGIGLFVIIEANSAEQANSLAESIGIYFNGCEKGYDCECCGDRWREVDGYDKEEKLSYFDLKEYARYSGSWNSKAYVHFLNGKIKEINDEFITQVQ